MSDPFHHHDADREADEIGAEARAEVSALLGEPSMWEENDPADEAAILAAIGELAVATPISVRTTGRTGADRSKPIAATGASDDSVDETNVVSISTARRWLGPFAAGVAAAVALVVGVSVLSDDAERNGVELALTGTDLAPSAEGVVEIVDTPNGTVLLLDVSGLPPAPDGSYYEAWVRQDANVGVSAGTFHLRGGGGEIELWAGVTTEDYPLFTITIQDEADPVSSGRVVLRGLVGE